MVDLYQTYRSDIAELVSIALVSITLVKLDLRQAKNGFVWKFRNYVRIMLGSYVRLTLGSYVIKPCKLEVTSGLRYKIQVRITSGSNVRFTSGNYVIKLCK